MVLHLDYSWHVDLYALLSRLSGGACTPELLLIPKAHGMSRLDLKSVSVELLLMQGRLHLCESLIQLMSDMHDVLASIINA